MRFHRSRHHGLPIPMIHHEGPLRSTLCFGGSRGVGGNIDWRIKKLQGFLDSPGGDLTLNLDRISRDLGLEVSGSHAARLFKRDLGIGVREYAKRKRLGAAAVSLRSGALPIKQIGASAGYQRAQDFSPAFLAMFQ